MHKALLVVLVGVLGFVLGVAIAGRPRNVPSDVVASEIRVTSNPTTTTAHTTSTAPLDTTTPSTDADTTVSTPPSTAPATTTTLVPERSIRVVVANATSVARLAARTVEGLRRYGYVDLVATDAISDRPDTVIYYVDGRHREALRLAAQLGLDSTRVYPRPALDLTVSGAAGDVWLVIGKDLGGG